MFITIRQDVHVLQTRQRTRSGFTLPEVLVSLCILIMVLQCAWQWNLLTQRTQMQQQENRRAITLAEAALSNAEVSAPDGWQVCMTVKDEGNGLQDREVTVRYNDHSWKFYYTGEVQP